MPAVDHEGRIFGRLNLIDAALLALAVVLIPAAYGTYWLFRAPTPEVDSFTPTRFSTGDEVRRVTIRGRHLRPYLRVFVGGKQGQFLLRTAEEAQVELPPLPPGTYDLALFDEALELKLHEKAIVVTGRTTVQRPPGTTVVRVTGSFQGLTADQAAKLYTDRPLLQRLVAEWSNILAVGPPEADTIQPRGFITIWNPIQERFRLPAVLRVQCQVRGAELSLLSARGISLADDPELKLTSEERAILRVVVTPFDELAVPVPLETPPSDALGLSHLTFLTEEVFPGETTPLSVRVRILTVPEVLAVVRRSFTERSTVFADLNPRLLSVDLERGSPGAPGDALLLSAIATIRVPAVRTPRGWLYRNEQLKPGASFTLSASSYNLSGVILSVVP